MTTYYLDDCQLTTCLPACLSACLSVCLPSLLAVSLLPSFLSTSILTAADLVNVKKKHDYRFELTSVIFAFAKATPSFRDQLFESEHCQSGKGVPLAARLDQVSPDQVKPTHVETMWMLLVLC